MAKIPMPEEMIRNVAESVLDVEIDGKTLRKWIDILKEYPSFGWISVKGEPPKEWKAADGTLINYLVYMPEYGVDVGNYVETAGTWVCMGLPVKVTHWMPLPEPPKEE